MNRSLNVCNGIKGFSWDSDMIVDSCINSDFNVVPGESVESVEVDNIGFHIKDMNFIGARVKVLQTRSYSFYVSSESFVNSLIK